MQLRRSLPIVLALAPAALLAPAMVPAWAPARAQDKPVHLKLAHWVPPSHPLQKAMEDWGSSLQKATNGTVTFTVFPSQQLGKAFDHYDMARDGIADVTYINPGYQPGRFPIIDAGNLPFMMSNGKGGSQALDAWYRKYAGTEMKDVKFCLGFVHDYGSFHSRTKKVVVPGDVKGMKIRPAHATIATLVTQLGGTNVQASAPEVRDVIEKGVADAVTFPWGSIPLFGIDKVTKYHMNTPLYVDRLRLGDEQEHVPEHVADAAEGDRRPLHHRVGAARGRTVGRLRAGGRRQAAGRHRLRPRGVHHHRRAARRVAQGRGAGGEGVGRRRTQGRRRPRRGAGASSRPPSPSTTRLHSRIAGIEGPTGRAGRAARRRRPASH